MSSSTRILTAMIVSFMVLQLCSVEASIVRPQCGRSMTFVVTEDRYVRFVNTARWMTDLKDRIGPKKMSQVKIPATHDSGTSPISEFIDFSNDVQSDPALMLIPQLVYVFGQYGLNQSLVKAFVAPWFKNQACSVADQLRHGIRHFDLRVCVRPGIIGPNKFYSCHGILGENYVSMLTDIRDFMDAKANSGNHEFVSLDFNHLYGFNAQLNNEFLNMTRSIVGPSIVPGSFGRTVNDLKKDQSRLFVWYADTVAAAAWNVSKSSDLPTPWANRQDMVSLVADLKAGVNNRVDFDHGYVTQFVMTPDLNMMVSGIISGQSSVLDVANNWYGDIATTLRDQFMRAKINIVNTDFYSKDFLETLITMN